MTSIKIITKKNNVHWWSNSFRKKVASLNKYALVDHIRWSMHTSGTSEHTKSSNAESPVIVRLNYVLSFDRVLIGYYLLFFAFFVKKLS